MKPTTLQNPIVLVVAAVLCLAVNGVHAQESRSRLMAGLEQPFSQPLYESVAAGLSQNSAVPQRASRIQQQSYAVYEEQVMAPTAVSYQNCGNLACSDCQDCADACVKEQSWWQKKCQKMNRKCYFNYQGYHPNALHPIVHPACQPGYGYYETCWRKIAPNPCFCHPEYGPVISNESGQLAPAAEGEPLPPAPAYDR